MPIAAVEQHGRHLPVFTDSMLLGEVVRRAAEPLGDRVIWAPLLWLGNSHHHIDFAGTLSAAPRTYLDVLGDLIDNLVTHGFRRIVLLNGHGGNIVPAQPGGLRGPPAVPQPRRPALAVGDLLAPRRKPARGRSVVRPGPDGTRLRVGDLDDPAARAAPGRRPAARSSRSPSAIRSSRRSRGWITQERSAAGHIGDPRQATAEKGETLFRLFSGDVVTFLERVIAWDGRSWDG